MLCDICHKREAKIYYTEIKNGEKKEQYLCEECAAEHSSFPAPGGEGLEATIGGFLSNILGNIYGTTYGTPKDQEKDSSLPVCEFCKTSYDEVLKTGKFGCAHCYDSFRNLVDKSLNQIQGANTHTGKKPAKEKEAELAPAPTMTEQEKLAFKLQEAIEREEFEEAAKLRDRIRELKGEESCTNGTNKKENTAM